MSHPENRPRKQRYATTVKRVQRLTARMLRVVFGGPALADFNWNGPAAHIKLILGSDSAEVRAPSRTYTPRHFDAATQELTVDFVLHGEGPASAWASQAQIGQAMLIAGPGRSYAVDTQAQWLLLAGDESAIPAIATIVEAAPPGIRLEVLLEVNDAADEFAVAPRRPDVGIRWLHRAQPIVGHGGAARAGVELFTAVRAFQPPAGGGGIYVACEADAMRRLRHHLLIERALPPEWVTTRGYWKQGATDYPDRDYGEDVT
ncbi:MAG TPA: siderophore-interacting protein [Steroidobacteraceae bacterium]|jgi:NADPH-dependent ferric siderophore reductase|nr:siderophore-interacting protein [Steroidobacteraceae bacterium]